MKFKKYFSSEVKNSHLQFELYGRPSLLVAIPLGLQHVFAMFISNMTAILILISALSLGHEDRIFLVQMAMFSSGLATLLQLYPIGRVGSRLPITMGTGISFLGVAIIVGTKYGLPGVFGAVLVGALVEIGIGVSMKHIHKFFTPVVTGIVVLGIGFSLFKIGINYFAGGNSAELYGSGENLLIGLVTMLSVLAFSIYGKGMFKSSSLLIGLVVGVIFASFFGVISFDYFETYTWISFPVPFKFGIEFHLDAILLFSTIYLISAMETIGDCNGVAIGGLNREATKKEIQGAVLADGIGSAIAAVFNSLPKTSYSQNVGIVSMTKVVNRFIIATGAVIIILASFFPKFGALFVIIPPSVLGGLLVVIVGVVAVTGIRMIARGNLAGRDGIIVGLSLSIGFGVTQTPLLLEQFLPGGNFESAFLDWYFTDVIIAAGLLAFVLNIILPKDKIDKENIIQK